MKYHLSQYPEGSDTPVCLGVRKHDSWAVDKNTWDALPAGTRCKRCLGKMERASFAGWLDAQKPRFSTRWERNDYDREQRGEKPLGPPDRAGQMPYESIVTPGEMVLSPSELRAEIERLRAALERAKNRLTNNVPPWVHEWPGIAGAVAEIDAALAE